MPCGCAGGGGVTGRMRVVVCVWWLCVCVGATVGHAVSLSGVVRPVVIPVATPMSLTVFGTRLEAHTLFRLSLPNTSCEQGLCTTCGTRNTALMCVCVCVCVHIFYVYICVCIPFMWWLFMVMFTFHVVVHGHVHHSQCCAPPNWTL